MLRQPRGTSIEVLHRSAKVVEIADRLFLLVERYLANSIHNNNPLIIQLCNEFFAFGNGRIRRKPTLLDPHRNSIQLALSISSLAVSV
jgi:hypothetical protein